MFAQPLEDNILIQISCEITLSILLLEEHIRGMKYGIYYHK